MKTSTFQNSSSLSQFNTYCLLLNIKHHLANSNSHPSILTAIFECAELDDDIPSALHILHRSIPLSWRLRFGTPWARDQKTLTRDIDLYCRVVQRREDLLSRTIKHCSLINAN